MTSLHEQLFNLRVLIGYDDTYKVYVARCLETGSVVTADDQDTAKSMIKELLEDEIAFALEYRNLANLFSTPAPIEVWQRWQKVVKKPDAKVESLPLNVDVKEIFSDDRENLAGVKMALAA
jgi:hypothetical protein